MIRISELPAAASVGTANEFEINEAGTSKKVTANQIAGFVAGGPKDNVAITGGSITGITDLAVADGGSGVSTITGIIKGNGISAFSAANAGTDYLAPFGTQTQQTFFAAPNAISGTPSFRAIVATDVPTLNQNTTGTASSVTGNVAVANGGTGLTTLTASAVLVGNGTSNVSTVSPGASGNVLSSNGSAWVSATPVSGGFTNISVFTASGTFTVPSGVTKVKVTVVGGGGGGSISSTAGTSGGTSSFGAFCSATGGLGVNNTTIGTGGLGSSGNLNARGAHGIRHHSGSDNISTFVGHGGVGFYGHGAGGSTTTSSTSGIIASPGSASGGGAGGMAIGIYTVTPATGITVTVGAAGANNSGSTVVPVAGIVIVEY